MAGGVTLRNARRAAVLAMSLGAAVVGLASSAAAQRGTASLTAQLVDQKSRAPVAGARIRFLGTSLGTQSDSTGRFATSGLVAGIYLLEVRAVGYAKGSWVLRLGDRDAVTEVFELAPLPVELDPVVVERQPSFAEQRRLEFERRRASGRGHFITEDEIAQVKPRMLADLFRTVPGVRLLCRGAGTDCTLRMARAARPCKPDFILDGFPATNSTGLDMPTVGIIGIEIYRTLSETPFEFLRAHNECGTIVIWTRSGPG
jgi:hypothetical protein